LLLLYTLEALLWPAAHQNAGGGADNLAPLEDLLLLLALWAGNHDGTTGSRLYYPLTAGSHYHLSTSCGHNLSNFKY
jgi:hypothetical protein